MNRPTRVVLIAGSVAAVAAVLSRVGLSRVVSKYVGETEQSLDRTFDEADAQEVVLLDDDSDELFDADEDSDDDSDDDDPD
jgi:SpoVK/Ycf46/Vps4 family AAA+-type ATPase